MLTDLPAYVVIIFVATVLLTFLLFVNAVKTANDKGLVTGILIMWLGIQGTLAYKGFYQYESGTPPRFILAVLPGVVFIIILLIVAKKFINGLDLQKLTMLHIVRIPVELTLYWLAAQKFIPELMTFGGRNFDIVSGITAPIIFFTCFRMGQIKNKSLLLIWNFICLALLFNIVINAILSMPTRFQQFAFDQPNVGLFFFPFIWLPCFIVMVVLLSHLVVITRLLKKS